MKVAIDASPLSSGHRVRGIGSYTNKLIESLKSIPQVNLELFTGKDAPEADIVHYPYFDLFFHTLPDTKKQKQIVTIHDVIPLVFPNHFPVGIKGYINLFFQKRALKNVDFVICDSKTSKVDIIDKLSFPKDRITPIYLAASTNFKKVPNTQKLLPLVKRFKTPKIFTLYVGDVNWNKNLENLISSVKTSKVPLLMVGSAAINDNVPQTKALNGLIKKLNIEDLVTKTGFVTEEELEALYNLASVTLLPSYYEGFGLPVLESMACGTPVVCSNNSSLSEIAGPHAVFCDPQDPHDIAQKTLGIIKMNKKEIAILSQKLIIHAQKFSWRRTAQETYKVYQRALR